MDDDIELMCHLTDEGMHLDLRTKLRLDDLILPTLTILIPGASLYECGIPDIIDVTFEGHPNLARLTLSHMED